MIVNRTTRHRLPVHLSEVSLDSSHERLDRAHRSELGQSEPTAPLLPGLNHHGPRLASLWPPGHEHPIAQPKVTEHQVNELQDSRTIVPGHEAIIALSRHGASPRPELVRHLEIIKPLLAH
jgi:hypothetical protein